MANLDPRRSLGAAVLSLRQERGLTQEGLADAAGLHATYVSGIERGHRNPSWETMLRIAQALDVSLAEVARRAAD